jgi:hypothetical protein
MGPTGYSITVTRVVRWFVAWVSRSQQNKLRWTWSNPIARRQVAS